jgi:hypothetical protein
LKDLLVGTWQLISQGTQYPDGRIEASRGENPQGILMYDALGNMSVQLMRTDHRAADYTDLAQIATAFEGYHAYFGTYDVEETEKSCGIISSARPIYPIAGQCKFDIMNFRGRPITNLF